MVNMERFRNQQMVKVVKVIDDDGDDASDG